MRRNAYGAKRPTGGLLTKSYEGIGDAIPMAGALLVDSGRLLLMRASSDDYFLPKGHVEPGEVPFETAARELIEETGHGGLLQSFLCHGTFERHNRMYHLWLYEFAPNGESGPRDLSYEILWVPLDEAQHMLTYDLYRKAVQILRGRIAVIAAESIRNNACDEIHAALGGDLPLKSLSRPWARRPSFRILGQASKVRLFQSADEAHRVESILSYARGLPVPRVLRREGRVLVTTWLKGTPLDVITCPDRAILLEQAGELLGRIHATVVPFHEREVAESKTREYFIKRSEDSLRKLWEHGLVHREDAECVGHFLFSSMPSRLDVVVVHWDYVGGNLLWHEGHVAAVDFESSRLFAAGYDLSKALRFIGAENRLRKAFLRGYASVRSLRGWQSHQQWYDAFSVVRSLANRVDRPNLNPTDLLARFRGLVLEERRPMHRRRLLSVGSVSLTGWPRSEKSLPERRIVEIEGSHGSARPGTLVVEDCHTALAALGEWLDTSVDLIYIDPPFGKGSGLDLKIPTELGDRKIRKPAFCDSWGGDLGTYLEWCKSLFDSAIALLSNDGWIVVHTGWEYGAYLRVLLDAALGSDRFECELVWRYHWGTPKDTRPARHHDTLLVYRRSSASLCRHDDFEDVLTLPVATEPERCGYDTQKPVGLMRYLIEWLTDPEDLVLDPCVGSGTTLVAAGQIERRWVGVDRSSLAILSARKRLREAGLDFRVLSSTHLDEKSDLALSWEESNGKVRARLNEPESVEYWGVDWSSGSQYIEDWWSYRRRLDRTLASVSPWRKTGEDYRIAVRAYDQEGRISNAFKSKGEIR